MPLAGPAASDWPCSGANRFDFTLVAMLGLLGESSRLQALTSDPAKEHGHRVLHAHGKGRSNGPSCHGNRSSICRIRIRLRLSLEKYTWDRNEATLIEQNGLFVVRCECFGLGGMGRLYDDTS